MYEAKGAKNIVDTVSFIKVPYNLSILYYT